MGVCGRGAGAKSLRNKRRAISKGNRREVPCLLPGVLPATADLEARVSFSLPLSRECRRSTSHVLLVSGLHRFLRERPPVCN